MKRTSKYALWGLGLATCCFLVVFHLNARRARSYTLTFQGEEDSQDNRARIAGSRVSPKRKHAVKTVVKEKHRKEPKDIVTPQDYSETTPEVTTPEVAPTEIPTPSPEPKNQSAEDTIQVRQLPEWWTQSWQRSAVYGLSEQFVGDKPLFGACKGSMTSGSALYDFVEPPQQFLPPEECKNPCWYLDPKTQRGLRCAPYVYLAGVAKCGTSDLNKRLKKHPEVFLGKQKEYHWWERLRFGTFDVDDPVATIDRTGGMSFKEYLDEITGRDLVTLHKELRDNGKSRKIFMDFSPSYMWDPQNWYALQGNQGCEEPRIVVGQHIRHFYPPAKILMIFRHPTPRLYSRFMSRIHRTPELAKATVKDFHNYVDQGIKTYMKCFQKSSIRQCAYDVNLYKEVKVRLVEGMYPVFMEDWLRIWPRDQIMILRYEDYAGHERATIQNIMNFLGLSNLTREGMDEVMRIDIVNAGTEEYEKHGDMLPETKQLLDEFYQPFVDQFALILNQERFLWKDVYQ